MKKEVQRHSLHLSPKISVIVPVYKAEQYLDRCIASITNQTYKNLEIILVDDGSPDHCPTLCDQWAEKDNRIIVIHKENGGVSEARNFGLDIFTGEYVTFVDSDDWLDKGCITYLYALMNKGNCDVSVCDFYYITREGDILNKYLSDGSEEQFVGQNAVLAFLVWGKISASPWGKLYKREVFTQRRYPVGRIYEDIPMMCDIILSDYKISFGANPLYFYFYNESSISKATFKPNGMDRLIFKQEACLKITQKYPEVKEAAEISLFKTCFGILLTFDNDVAYVALRKRVLQDIRAYRNIVLKSTRSPNSWKIKALLTFLPYQLVQRIMKCIMICKKRKVKKAKETSLSSRNKKTENILPSSTVQ